MREDYQTLSESLGFSDAEIRELGLWEPASGPPTGLAEAYIRRSKKAEDISSLRGHLKDLVRRARDIDVQIRHVWFEQLSASKKSVTRREYAKAMQAVLDGRSKTFLVWKLDRFDRKGAGTVLSAVDQLDERRARLVTSFERFDSSAKGTRTLIAVFAENAKDEAEGISARVTNGLNEHKAMGRKGPGFAPYGLYSKPGSGKVEHHWTEYATAREMVDWALAGDGNSEVASKANSSGIKTRRGGTWRGEYVGKWLQNPIVAGMVPQRERREDEYGNSLDRWSSMAEPLYDEDGNPIRCGEGVMTADEFFQIRALRRSRRNEHTGRGIRTGVYLLTGSFRCPRCLGPAHGVGGKYCCAKRRDQGASQCLGITTRSQRLDDFMSELLISHVTALDPDSDELYEIGERWLKFNDPAAESRSAAATYALQDAHGRLQELDDQYWNPKPGTRRLDKDQYERQAAKLADSIQRLVRTVGDQKQRNRADVTPLLDPDLLAEAFQRADLQKKRGLIKCVWPYGFTISSARSQGDRTSLQDRLRILTEADRPSQRG